MPPESFPTTSDTRLPKISLSDISFEQLTGDHCIASFSCKNQELNDYLAADALKTRMLMLLSPISPSTTERM